jgi:hypothetical protein
MTSEERHQCRYERRKNKREKKKQQFLEDLPSFEQVFTFQNLYNSYILCKQGVTWKASMQGYEANLLVNLANLQERLLNHTYRSKGFHKFTIRERGKLRNIRSVNIDERIVQRCLCDYFLIPLLRRNLIYDNGATLKGKGTDFTLHRLRDHLYDYVKENGTEGYILIYDFTDYFNSINHTKLYEMLDPMILDDDLRELVHHFIDNFGDKGLGLGSQISQICAVAYPNPLDHYFKDELGVKGYGRYMDDEYIICKTKEDVKKCIDMLYKICAELDIKISERKLHISKITKPFIFLKKKIFVAPDGKVVMSLVRKTITHERRKLKKYYNKHINSDMPYKDVECAYLSWRGSARRFANHRAIKNMDELFNNLFIFNKEIFV